jgi:gamma-D-glutamyl-L-lysine dipeptidyl-peptidase
MEPKRIINFEQKYVLMERFICENVFVPLRAGPSHRTEMLSQVLFGEKYVIIDRSGVWIRVETVFDKYNGWIDTDHLQHSGETDQSPGFVLNRSLLCYKNDGTKLVLEAGCEIFNPDFEAKTFMVSGTPYTTDHTFNPGYVTSNESMADTALRFINSPYIWGGRIPSGIDCSGFTQLIYKIHGIPIRRNSWQQAEAGVNVDFIDESEPGDLVFFDNDQGDITHVGMILTKGLVIHGSGRVRIDRIDHQGIFKPEKNGYSHKLRLIRRVVPNT